MNKRILLIRPNCNNDKKEKYGTFPLGLAYIGAVLKRNGYEAAILDLAAEDVNYDNLAQRIKSFAPDVIGISSLSFGYIHVKRLARFIKKTINSQIILGGQLSTHSYKIVLENTDIDICIIGEGELTIIDLLLNLSSLEKVKGIAYKKDDNVFLNEQIEIIADLNTLPMPAYEMFNIELYSKYLMSNIYMSHKFLPSRRHLPKDTRHKVLAISTSRGCPYSCRYCTQMFSSIRTRSVENVIQEIKYLNQNYSINIFNIVDELFVSSKKRLYEFCEKVKPLGVSWYANARINFVDKQLLKTLVKSGCLVIGYGVESGSAKILANMDKKITQEQIEQTLKDTLEVGLPTSIGLILGYPGEDRNTIQETIDLLKRVGYPGTKFHYITPYPGSPLYKQSIEDGTIKDEERYLESLGDGSGPYKFRINFTDFTDEELKNLLPETSKKVLRNYLIYLLKNPKYLLRYLMVRDMMNPACYFYNRWCNPTNYDIASKKS